MLKMFKKKQSPPSNADSGSYVGGFLDQWGSPEDLASTALHELVPDILEKAGIDTTKRKIIWPDGRQLSITESAERIHTSHQELALDLIESLVIEWLEIDYAPPVIQSEKQLLEHNRQIERWVEDHQRGGSQG